MSNADTSTKKSLFKQWWFWLIAVVFFFGFIDMFIPDSTPNTPNNTPKQEEATMPTTNQPETQVVVATVPYEIYSEEDISIGGCKRVAIKVTMAADADKTAVDNTLNQILESKKSTWQDITVWGYSKDVDPSNVGANMGMKEYSNCN